MAVGLFISCVFERSPAEYALCPIFETDVSREESGQLLASSLDSRNIDPPYHPSVGSSGTFMFRAETSPNRDYGTATAESPNLRTQSCCDC